MINKKIIIGVNLGDFGSTGTIMRNSLEYASKFGNYDYLVIAPYSCKKSNSFAYCSKSKFIYKTLSFLSKKIKLTFINKIFTKKIISKISKMQKIYNFCYVHIHNIHSCNIDFKMLISKLSGMNIKIIYTLHDVWPITGGCFYYNFIGCKKWINGCNGICPQNYKRCNKSWEEKKNLFNLLKNKITFISVSKWLNNELEFSFLKDFKRLINPGECSIVPLNSIDNELINKMNLKNKKILITVSSYWNDWKGYKYIYEVADRLPENYVILVIGGLFDTRNKKNIIHISQLKNECLNSYYSIADCFVSVTQDDNLPLVLMEAQICGVPIVGFGHGGTPEEIIEGKTGYMVGTDNNVDLLVKKIRYVCEKKPFTITDIKKNGEKYKQYEHAKRMLKIYNNL